MTLDNMTGITKGSYTGFCKSQLITCSFVKACNGVCPFEDALKHADKMQAMNEQHTVDHDKDWIIGCIEHDGFIHTHRFDKANQIIHDALSADTVSREDTVTLNSPISIQADMVAVVRCKDCKWQKFIDWGMGDCLHPKGSRHIAYDNHYCSYGEKREERAEQTAEQTEYKLPFEDEIMERLDKLTLRGDKDE